MLTGSYWNRWWWRHCDEVQEPFVDQSVGASAPVSAAGCSGVLGCYPLSPGRSSCILLLLLFLLFLGVLPWLRGLQIACGARSKTIVTVNYSKK